MATHTHLRALFDHRRDRRDGDARNHRAVSELHGARIADHSADYVSYTDVFVPLVDDAGICLWLCRADPVYVWGASEQRWADTLRMAWSVFGPADVGQCPAAWAPAVAALTDTLADHGFTALADWDRPLPFRAPAWVNAPAPHLIFHAYFHDGD